MKRCFFAVLFVGTFLHAQGIEVTYVRLSEDYFLLGMRQYAHRDFQSAAKSFQSSIYSFPMNHRITASMVMVAKSLYAMQQYREASAACDSLLARFPDSEYREDAMFTKGMCYYNLGDYLSTFDLMEAVRSTAQQRLNIEHSVKVIEHIAAEFLPDYQIDSLILSVNQPEVTELLKVIRAERLFAAGNLEALTASIDRLLNEITVTVYRQRIQRLLGRIEQGNHVTIGVLLPLMNGSSGDTPSKKVATEILQGIQMALSEYEERMEPGMPSIGIDVRDTQRNADTINNAVAQLGAHPSIIGIIGPVFSDETMIAASAAMEQQIPLISPTATDDSIAFTGDYIFQANSTPSIRGKILAQYAVNVLGARRIAVVASDAPFAATQADSFAVEVQRLGGTIIFDRRYRRGEADLRHHFRALRSFASAEAAQFLVTFRGRMNRAEISSIMTANGFTLPFIDSVIARSATVNLTQFVGDRAKDLAEALQLPTTKQVVDEDSLHYPVTSVDAIFCPITIGQQIGVISSQIAFFNIKTTILGSSEWNNVPELDLNRRYADGVIFGSDRWVESNERTNRFAMRYVQKFGRQFTDNVLYGYDVTSLFIRMFNDGALTREQLREGFSRVVRFTGIRSSITLNYRRINSDLNILQYKYGTITKLQTYTYSPE
jgi:ABC-type branched-subunit amino acid transport system substrate-binding protein